MGTPYGHIPDPEVRSVYSRKSQPSKKKLRMLSDTVDVQIIDDDDNGNDYSMEDASKHLALYNPEIPHASQSAVEAIDPIYQYMTPRQRTTKSRARNGHTTVLPSIGAYTVQCANCYKWRIVPTKEKYEELRENICEELFVCARALEWGRILSCDEPEDMPQDESRLWALDKPNIAQTPPGWDREVRIRGEGSTRFADVYYTSPAGKCLRSMVEIGGYLEKNPRYVRQGVNLSQFSFAIPKPLQEDYVKKRKYAPAQDLPDELPNSSELAEVNPMGWAAFPTRKELLQLGTSASNPVNIDELPSDSDTTYLPPLPFKKRTPRQAPRHPRISQQQASSSDSDTTYLPPLPTKKRTLNDEASSSGGPKKRTLNGTSSSGVRKNITVKRPSSLSRESPRTPPSRPFDDRPVGLRGDIDHVHLNEASSSGRPKKGIVNEGSSSGVHKKITVKRPSSLSRELVRTPSSWPLDDQPGGFPSGVDQVHQNDASSSGVRKKMTVKRTPSSSSVELLRTPANQPFNHQPGGFPSDI